MAICHAFPFHQPTIQPIEIIMKTMGGLKGRRVVFPAKTKESKARHEIRKRSKKEKKAQVWAAFQLQFVIR